jgi:hypothetical protein
MARKEALIISEELFKALSPVSGDLDWNYVWPTILAVQDKWIQPTLGQKLYEKIMTDIDGGGPTGDYKDLLEDFVARTCVWFTCYQGLPFWGVKVVNSGIIQRIVDDGSPVDLNDIDKLAELCRGQAEFYKQRLIDYLCANTSKFTEYSQTDSGELGHESNNYAGGLNLESYTKPTKRGAWYLGDN